MVKLNNVLTHDCLGVVLAGGLSSRMGQNKAKLHHKNQSMLAYSKQLLADSGISKTIVSGDDYDIPDKIKKSGPVGGILSVLSAFPTVQSLLIIPVDLPLMTPAALTELKIKGELSQKATYFENHNIPLYLPNNAYLELFLAQVYADSNGAQVESSRFKNKGPSIKSLLNKVPNQAIHCSDTNVLFNSNTPQDWQHAKQQLNF